VKGTWRAGGGAPLLWTLRFLKKVGLVTGISFYRGPAGEPGRVLIYEALYDMDETDVSLHIGSFGEPGEGSPSTGNFEN
jgi:hypothetical protein